MSDPVRAALAELLEAIEAAHLVSLMSGREPKRFWDAVTAAEAALSAPVAKLCTFCLQAVTAPCDKRDCFLLFDFASPTAPDMKKGGAALSAPPAEPSSIFEKIQAHSAMMGEAAKMFVPRSASQTFGPEQCQTCGLYPGQTCARQPCVRSAMKNGEVSR